LATENWIACQFFVPSAGESDNSRCSLNCKFENWEEGATTAATYAPTTFETSICPTEWTIAKDCVELTNPACAECMDSVHDAIFAYTDTVSCDDYEQQICIGYEMCGCQTCEIPLSNLYSCIQGSSCPALDCTSSSSSTNAPSNSAITTVTASPTSRQNIVTNAPTTYTLPPTIKTSNDPCESYLNEASDCISNNNPECLDCLQDVENAITTTVTCGYFQQLICTGIETCGCNACQMQLEAVYSCVHESTCGIDFWDCSSAVSTDSPVEPGLGSTSPNENPTGAPESLSPPSYNNNTIQPPNGTTSDPTSSMEESSENTDGKGRLRNSGIFVGVLGGILLICIVIPVFIKAWRANKPLLQVVEAPTPGESEEEECRNGSSVETFPPPKLSELTGPSSFSVATSCAVLPTVFDTSNPTFLNIPTYNDQLSTTPTPLTEVETGALQPCSLLTLDSGGNDVAHLHNATPRASHAAALTSTVASHNTTFVPTYKDQARTVLAASANIPSTGEPSPSPRNSNILDRSGNGYDLTTDGEPDIPFAEVEEVDAESSVFVRRRSPRPLEP
jgi:hypothetical protein